MKKFFQFLAVACLVSSLAFAQEPKSATKGVTYGEKISKNGAIPVSELTQKMGTNETLTTKISGKVLEVCTTKGCWMKLENGNNEPIRVTFKDYAFFMPKDLVGKTVALDGFSKKTVTSIAELKHFAEDAGKSKEEIAKITAPKNEIKYEAKGVLVL
jgi:hypothetical protein